MTKTELSFFRAAKNVSALSNHPQHKVGCVVVDKHRIISSGFNSYTKCDSTQAKIDRRRFGVECPGKIHAEVSSLLPLIKSGVDLRRATVYVYRSHKNGLTAMARPCEGCMSLIRASGIRRVYYSTEDGFAREDVNNL